MKRVREMGCNLSYQSRLNLKGWFNTLRPRQNGRHFPDDILKWIFMNENVWISIKISLQFVPKGQINNIPALLQMMAWRRPGDKPLSEPMMVRLLTHICVARPQWVNTNECSFMLRYPPYAIQGIPSSNIPETHHRESRPHHGTIYLTGIWYMYGKISNISRTK